MKGDNSVSKRTFYLLWFGQFLSLLGTDITKFALRVWTYQKTQSVTEFALITVFTELPSFLISPFAGAFVDRYDRKWVMLFSDAGSAISTFTLYMLYSSNYLEFWHIYIANITASILNGFQWPAFTASVTLLIPKDQVAKFGGFNQAAPALSMLFAPLVAGTIVSSYGLNPIFMIEFITFLLASCITMMVTIPAPPPSEEGQAGKGNVWSEIAAAWSFVSKRPGLVGLLFFLANGQFSSGLVQVLMTPMILNFASSAVLGQVLSVSGTGALFGSIILSFYGGPKRKIFGVLACAFLQGFLLSLCGLSPNATLILAVAFSYMFFIPLVRVCRESIWQRKTPADMQGRIFSLQRMIQQLAIPMASIISGPLADQVFEPLLAKNGALASTVIGDVIGVGPGRGVALLFIILGVTNMLTSVLGLMYGPLRRVDIDLPDMNQVDDKKQK